MKLNQNYNISAISRLFTSSVVKELARKGQSPLFARLLNEANGTVPLTTTVLEGEVVRVDVSMTSDVQGDNLTLRWQQVGGIEIELGESSTPLLSFNAAFSVKRQNFVF